MFLLLFALGSSLRPSVTNRFSPRKTGSIKKISLPKNYNNGFGCEMCTKVVEYIESLMKDETVESEIAKLVEQLCETFPSPYSSLCDSLVEQYVPIIMQWLEEGLESLDVCSKIGLCSTETKKPVRAVRLPKKEIENGLTCEACKFFFTWAESKLEEVTVESLWALVNEQCPNVPYLQYICQYITEQNIDTIVSLILAQIPTETCCSWVGLC